MKAGYYAGPGNFSLADVPYPELEQPDEVIIEIETAGMCGTDFHIVSVPQLHPAKEGIVLGHEFVGKVVEVGKNVENLPKDTRVIAGPNIWCGECDDCRRGSRNLCGRVKTLGITRNGGFASYVAVPSRVLYPVCPSISPESAIFAEPLSCVLNGFSKLKPCYGENIVILGSGPIGLYFTRLFRYFGAKDIIVAEPLSYRRQAALESGATHALDSSSLNENLYEEISDLTQGGPSTVVDTTGFLLSQGLKIVKRGGTVLIFGMDNTCVSSIEPFDIVRNEKTIIGCFVNNDLIPKSLDLVNPLNLNELISHKLSLDDIMVGLNAVKEASSIKVLLYPNLGYKA